MEKDSKNSFIKICSNILGILVAICLIILCLGAIILTAKFTNQYYYEPGEMINIGLDNILVNLICIVVFCLAIIGLYKVLKNIKEKPILIISLIIIALIGVFWVNYVKVPVKADQSFVYNIAFQFLSGDFHSLNEGQYLFWHPLQLGIIYFVMLVYKIINIKSPLVFQNLNIIFVIISTIFLYKICKRIYKNEKTNKICLILLPLFIVMPILSILVYGNVVSLMFALISVYFVIKYLDERKIRELVIAGISIIISIILKQNSEVFLIAECIIIFLDFIKSFRKSNLVFIVITVIITILSTPAIYKLTEICTGKEVNDGIPMITYVAMGMAEETDRAPRMV